MVVFSENGKSHYKITKNYFSCRNVCVLAHINVPLLVLSSPFLLNFGALMKWPPFGIHDLITMSDYLVITFRRGPQRQHL